MERASHSSFPFYRAQMLRPPLFTVERDQVPQSPSSSSPSSQQLSPWPLSASESSEPSQSELCSSSESPSQQSSSCQFDSSWSEADSLVNPECTDDVEPRQLVTQVLSLYGTLGLVILRRKAFFDRKLLTSLDLDEKSPRETMITILQALSLKCHRQQSHRSKYLCLKMIDRCLPQSLLKIMMRCKSTADSKQLAMFKLVIDYRLYFYAVSGLKTKHEKYIKAAFSLHKQLGSSQLKEINALIREWALGIQLPFLLLKQSKREYLAHYHT